MFGKTASVIMLSLLVTSALALAYNIQPVRASGIIYIRADGSVDPPTAPISTTDNITYMFTDNIYSSSGIIVQKSGIVVDGNGYVLNSKYEYGRGNYGFGLSNVNNITIENTSIRDFGNGIIIDQSDDNVVLGNNITGSLWDGVWIQSSWNNSLCGNRVERNSYGIGICSPYNLVYGNWISNNWIGIRVYASNVNLTKNLFNSNDYQLTIEQNESDWRDYVDFIDSSNLIDGKPVYYLMNEKDLVITPTTYPDIGYLGLVNCTNITIENLTLRSNGQGLLFANTNNSRVIHNNIESNLDNVVLISSFDNTFSENNLTDNRFFGAVLLSSSSNRFYHNNFIFGPLSRWRLYDFGSPVNTWDDGYPSGGNYWSDYTGTDLYRGPYQNETGSDGIGDSACRRDNYPLMNPYSAPPPPFSAFVDISPDMLNLKGKGEWVAAYVELPEGYNVADISISIMLLNYTVLAELSPTAIGDHDGDGIPDLMVSFNRTTVSQFILSEGIMVGNVTLVITGQLHDRTMFEGSDIIGVKMPGDVNSDGRVDMADMYIASRAFGASPGRSRWNPLADENEDGKIDMQDLFLIARNFGKAYP